MRTRPRTAAPSIVESDSGDRLIASRPTLERLLVDNVLPFWRPIVIDADGGYRLNHDAAGRFLGPGPKGVVSQARMLWFFSRLSRSPWGEAGDLDGARHGVRFLRERLWDHEFGGFCWELPVGRPLRRQKEALGQAYALFGLAEYVCATDDADARELLVNAWETFDAHCHDDVHGGYHELRGPDWGPAEPRLATYTMHPSEKTLGVQMHVLEAILSMVRCGITANPSPADRLAELTQLLLATWGNTPTRPGHAYFGSDWGPSTRRGADQRWYGHDVETLWMLVESWRSLGRPVSQLTPFVGDVMDDVLTHGFDWVDGGFYSRGDVGRAAHATVKDYWTQAEGLVASLVAHELSGDPLHAESYLRTLDWIVDRQADWDVGDWHEKVDRRGRTQGVKAWGWKDPYHQTRALIDCIERLDAHPTPSPRPRPSNVRRSTDLTAGIAPPASKHVRGRAPRHTI